jgi:eukaryotic-like serine/threonine-protein kinase
MTQSESGPGSETTQQSSIDEICSRFEEAWKKVLDQGGVLPQMDDYWRLPTGQALKSEGGEKTDLASPSRELLINLALTDLEYRWRLAAKSSSINTPQIERPRLEDYVVRQPALGPLSELPIDVIEEEFSIRHLFGDRPGVEEYISRFGSRFPDLGEQLACLQKDLESGRTPKPFPYSSEKTSTRQPFDEEVQAGSRIRYLGDYELLEELGRGAMGVVFKARQVSLNRLVAVKMILAGVLAREEDVRRFHAEAKAAASLDHPGIVPIFEVGQHEGHHYFSMGYVEGESLSRRIAENPLPPREAARIMAQVAEAVECAHGKGVIHRDLKPANILLDQSGQPRVTDFGLAKRLDQDSSLSVTGDRIGTPSYMPPEQASCQNKRIDARSDVYSLGATLYAMLSGRPPFYADNPTDTCFQVIQQEPIPLRQLNPKLPRDLETICLKCLEKDPRRRYPSAREFAAELTRFIRSEPILARPVSRSERLWRWCRRNPAVAALIATVVVTLVGGTIISSAFAVIANRERDRAEVGENLATERLAQVEAEKKKAEEERRIAQAVRDFLQTKLLGQANVREQANSLLRGGGSSAAAKENPTIRELLDRAAAELASETIEANFPNQPLLQAEILKTVGETYRGVGEYQRSIGFLERAVALYRTKQGPNHPDTLSSMNSLANAYCQVGKLDLALPLCEETLKLTKAKLGPNHPNTLSSMNNLAMAYRDAGKLDLALPLFEETLKLRKAKLGPEHPGTLVGMNNLARAYQDAGKLDLALPLFEKTLKLTKAKLGPDHPDTFTSMNNLAGAYHDAGKLDLALPLFEETLKLRKAKLGTDHPETLASINSLARAYQNADKLDLALPLFEDSLKLMKAKLGPDHPDTLSSMNNLASAYRQAGKLDLALPLFEETLKLTKAKQGPDHPDTLSSMNNLANAYLYVGKLDLALPLIEETLKLVKVKLGPDHPHTLASMNILSLAYFRAGKLDLALPLLEETLKLKKVKQGLNHPDTLTTMNNLAVTYWKLAKLDKSIPLLEETLRLREAKLGRQHPDTLGTVAILGLNHRDAGRVTEALPLLEEVYRAAKKYPALHWVGVQLLDGYVRAAKSEQATTLANEILADTRKQLPIQSPQLAGQLAAIASSLLQVKAFPEAESLLRECLEIREKTEAEAWTTFNTKSMLGGALLAQKKFAAAKPLLLAGYEGMKQCEAKIPPESKVRVDEAIERLIQLAKVLEKKDDEAKWRTELEVRKKSAR